MTKKNQFLKFEKYQEKEVYQDAVLHLAETEQRLKQKRKEFEDVKQCGARLTKHRFSY